MRAASLAVFALPLLAAAPAAGTQVRCLSSFPAPDGRLQVAPQSGIPWMSEPVNVQWSRAWAIPSAISLQEFSVLWAALAGACAVVHLWSRAAQRPERR